jgi:RNA methyltransferase, RsmE family
MQQAKSLTRIYFPGEVAAHGVCELDAEQSHRMSRVLRLQIGDAVTLFDGQGAECRAVIAAMTKAAVRLQLAEWRAVDRESPAPVAIAQGISSGERMDYTVQKAVELGAVRIQPLSTERSVVHLDAQRAAKRVAHWQAIAVAACAQCGRNRVPVVAPVMSLAAWLASVETGAERRLFLTPDGACRLHELERPAHGVWLLCGPEGGLAPAEQRDAAHAGFDAVRLGPRVLRTETAAMAALAAMQTLWGDF